MLSSRITKLSEKPCNARNICSQLETKQGGFSELEKTILDPRVDIYLEQINDIFTLIKSI